MQRDCVIDIYVRKFTVYRQLWIPVLLFFRSLKIDRQLCVFFTQKLAVKSSRRTRRIFSTIAISLVLRKLAAREQMNKQTAFIDGSAIYGNSQVKQHDNTIPTHIYIYIYIYIIINFINYSYYYLKQDLATKLRGKKKNGTMAVNSQVGTRTIAVNWQVGTRTIVVNSQVGKRT